VPLIVKTLGAIVGTFHGLVGLLGLVLYSTGPEPWNMLAMALALASTPAALVLGVWGGRRIAAAWLACAALAWAVAGDRAYSEWWYASLFYGPQLIAALFLLRQAADTAPDLPVLRSAATPSAAAAGRRIAWVLGLVVGVGHAALGLWLTIVVGSHTAWTPGWWMTGVVSLLSTLPAVMSERTMAGSGGRWLVGAAYLGAFATGRTMGLSPIQLAVALLVWWLPQLLLAAVFLRSPSQRSMLVAHAADLHKSSA
jgi:hypothetical protein